MCFKNRVSTILIGVLLTVQGCGLNTGEKPPENNPPSFSGKGYSCVGQIPQHLEKYVADELGESEISDFMRCLQKAFSSFAQLTRGRDQSTYAPEEIRRFLQTYFLRERPITDKLMHEFMVLKQVIVGGEIDRITRPELAALIEVLEDIRVEAIRLKPHLKYLNSRLAVHQNPEDVGAKLQTANDALKASIRVFSSRLKKGTRDYPFENLEVLIREFRGFVRWDDHFPDSHTPATWVRFLKAFKKSMITPIDGDVLRPVDWSPFLESLTRWYLAYVEYRVGIKNQPKLHGVGLLNTVHLSQEVFELLEEAVNRQPGKTLGLTQITSLIATFQDLNWLTPGIRAQSLDKVLNALLSRVFADENRNGSSSSGGAGLTLKSLALMKYEFYRWAYIQMQLNGRFKTETERKETLGPAVPNLQANFFIPLDVRSKLQTFRDSDWEAFLKIRNLERPLFNDNLARVTLVPEADLAKHKLSHDFNNLSMMNLFRSAVGLLFRGYASEQNSRDWNSGLKRDELQAFYEDIRDLAIDLGLADQRVFNTGARAFIEGNLFTYAAGGIDVDVNKSRLTYLETMELLAFLYSGGLTSRDYYDRLKEVCPHGPIDLNGEVTFNRNCVRKTLADLVIAHSGNLPGLVSYLQSAKPDKRQILVDNIIDTAYSPRTSNLEWVERSELSIMAVVLHYLEAVLTRFDRNGDGKLTNSEIRAAVPIFTGYIQRFAKDQMKTDLTEREAQGVFIYILAYKNIPSYWNLMRIYDFSVDWYWEYEIAGVKFAVDLNKPVTLDRTELSMVFKAIVSKIFETSPNSVVPN